MAQARKIPGINHTATFAGAAASAVEVRSQEVFSFADGVLDTTDPERVHDMRVATRRLRAALEIFAVCFPKAEHKALLREVKRLADVLGARRDPDVQILALEELKAELGNGESAGLNRLLVRLHERQADGNEKLRDAIEHARVSELEKRLAALARS